MSDKHRYKAKVGDFPGGREVTFLPEDKDAPSIPAKYYRTSRDEKGDEVKDADFDKYKDGRVYTFDAEGAATELPVEQAPPDPNAAELEKSAKAAKKAAKGK